MSSTAVEFGFKRSLHVAAGVAIVRVKSRHLGKNSLVNIVDFILGKINGIFEVGGEFAVEFRISHCCCPWFVSMKTIYVIIALYARDNSKINDIFFAYLPCKICKGVADRIETAYNTTDIRRILLLGKRKTARRREKREKRLIVTPSATENSGKSRWDRLCPSDRYDGRPPIFDSVRDTTAEAAGRETARSSLNIGGNTIAFLTNRKLITQPQAFAANRLQDDYATSQVPGKSSFAVLEGGRSSGGGGSNEPSDRAVDAGARVARALAACAEYRSVVSLVIIDNMTIQGAAGVIRINRNTAAKRLKTGLDKLAGHYYCRVRY